MADVQYYGKLSIGQQKVNAVYDTGSFELLVLSKKCNHCGNANRLYDSSESKAHKYGSMRVMHSFGSGTLYSKEAYDTVRDGPFQAQGVPFWEVYDANMPVLQNSHIESIAGLAPFPKHFAQMRFQGPNDDAFASLQSSFDIHSFAMCLGNTPRSDGHLIWNDKSPTESAESFAEVQLALEDVPHWTAPLENVRLGKHKLACKDGCGGIVDSGTSLLAVPQSVATKLQEMVSELQTDCSDLSGLPHLHFRLGGVDLSLPPDSYIYKTEEGETSAGCKALVMTLDLPDSDELGEMWILGMPFLRKYYTVFQQHPARLFVAEADEDCEPKEWSTSSADESLDGGARTNVITPRSVNVSQVRWPRWWKRSGMSASGGGERGYMHFAELDNDNWRGKPHRGSGSGSSSSDKHGNGNGAANDEDEDIVEVDTNSTVPDSPDINVHAGGQVVEIPLDSQLEIGAEERSG